MTMNLRKCVTAARTVSQRWSGTDDLVALFNMGVGDMAQHIERCQNMMKLKKKCSTLSSDVERQVVGHVLATGCDMATAVSAITHAPTGISRIDQLMLKRDLETPRDIADAATFHKYTTDPIMVDDNHIYSFMMSQLVRESCVADKYNKLRQRRVAIHDHVDRMNQELRRLKREYKGVTTECRATRVELNMIKTQTLDESIAKYVTEVERKERIEDDRVAEAERQLMIVERAADERRRLIEAKKHTAACKDNNDLAEIERYSTMMKERGPGAYSEYDIRIMSCVAVRDSYIQMSNDLVPYRNLSDVEVDAILSANRESEERLRDLSESINRRPDDEGLFHEFMIANREGSSLSAKATRVRQARRMDRMLESVHRMLLIIYRNHSDENEFHNTYRNTSSADDNQTYTDYHHHQRRICDEVLDAVAERNHKKAAERAAADQASLNTSASAPTADGIANGGQPMHFGPGSGSQGELPKRWIDHEGIERNEWGYATKSPEQRLIEARERRARQPRYIPREQKPLPSLGIDRANTEEEFEEMLSDTMKMIQDAAGAFS